MDTPEKPKKWVIMKKFIIDGKEFETADEATQFIIDNIDEQYYDKMLDDCYGDIKICSYSYTASNALKGIDEIAYRCGYNDYTDSLYTDILDEIKLLEDSDIYNNYDIEVECIGNDEE